MRWFGAQVTMIEWQPFPQTPNNAANSFAESSFEGGDDPGDDQPVDDSVLLDGADESDNECQDVANVGTSITGSGWTSLASGVVSSSGNLSAATDTGVFYANGSGQVWGYNTTQSWNQIVSNVAITYVAAGSAASRNIYGLDANGVIYLIVGGTQGQTTVTWAPFTSGRLKQLSAAGDNTLAGTNSGNAYYLPNGSTQWIQVHPPVTPSQMVIANHYFGYVLGFNGSVWEYSTQNNTFTALPTNVTFKEIAAQEGTFKYNNVTVPEVYGLTSAGSIYKESCEAFNSLTGQCITEGPWVLVSGVTALHIALGRDYNVYAGTSSGLSQFFGSMTKTAQITGVRAGAYISQNANFTFSNFAPGGGVGGSGFGRVTNSCSGVLFSYSKLFALDEGRFYTQAKYSSIENCYSDPTHVTTSGFAITT